MRYQVFNKNYELLVKFMPRFVAYRIAVFAAKMA